MIQSYANGVMYFFCNASYRLTRIKHPLPPTKNILLFKYFKLKIGFQNGSVFWDDEDSNNSNLYGGILPSGVYNWDTRINYCCRNGNLSILTSNFPYLVISLWLNLSLEGVGCFKSFKIFDLFKKRYILYVSCFEII